MTVVAPSPMTFSHSDNDLARHLGLLGEQLDSNLSQEFAGLPSIDFASILNSDMLAPSPVKLESRTVSQSAEQDAQDADSDADASDSDAESSSSDDDTAAVPQQPETPHHLRGDLPESSSPLVAVPASQTLCNIPASSAALPLHGTSSSLRVSHPAMPHTSQGFVALSDINTASGQGHSHSVSSSPSSALGGTSSNPFEHANSGSVLAEQQKGKRKADQTELDTILDPAEKKKQRRLAKNRATAALSRCVASALLLLYGLLLLLLFCLQHQYLPQTYLQCAVEACSTAFPNLQGKEEGTVASASAEGAIT